MLDESGKVTLTSKYLGQAGFVIDEDPNNNYWRAAKNSGLLARLRGDTRYEGLNIQVCAEVIPCQKGFNYGCSTEPTLKVFKLVIDGVPLALDTVFDWKTQSDISPTCGYPVSPVFHSPPLGSHSTRMDVSR
jgi:hypothetical protein